MSLTEPGQPKSLFPPTRWSVVMAVQDESSPDAATALEQICRDYWYPLYVFIRRSGKDSDEARDLTQEFFARVLAKGYLRTADRDKGKLRTFLVVLLRRFLANEWDRQSRLRRGGGQSPLPFDTQMAEERYSPEPVAIQAADDAYDRRWAVTLLERTMQRLAADYKIADRGADFTILKSYLAVDRATLSYAEVAKKLGLNEGAARTAVHRLRRRFRDIFREEVSQTVTGPDEAEAEVRHLVMALNRVESEK